MRYSLQKNQIWGNLQGITDRTIIESEALYRNAANLGRFIIENRNSYDQSDILWAITELSAVCNDFIEKSDTVLNAQWHDDRESRRIRSNIKRMRENITRILEKVIG